MAKKATSKAVKVETPTLDPLEDAIPTQPTTTQNDPFDDDPFSSGVDGAIKPVRSEPEDELSMTTPNELDDEPDDFGQGFLKKDEEISETFKAVEVDVFDESLSENVGVLRARFGTDKVVKEYEDKIAGLKEENARLKKELESLPKLSPATISDQFDQLYQTLKEGRATELLMAVQKDYLDLKYNSYTEKERKEIELHLKEFLRERFEGKVKAAKLIHKQDEKGKS
jgi:hypothetical protein